MTGVVKLTGPDPAGDATAGDAVAGDAAAGEATTGLAVPEKEGEAERIGALMSSDLGGMDGAWARVEVDAGGGVATAAGVDVVTAAGWVADTTPAVTGEALDSATSTVTVKAVLGSCAAIAALTAVSI